MARIPEGCFENSPARSTATCGEKTPIVPAPHGGASNQGFRFAAPPRGAESRYPCTPHVAVLRAGLFSLCPRRGRQAAMRLPYGVRSAANPDRVTSVVQQQLNRIRAPLSRRVLCGQSIFGIHVDFLSVFQGAFFLMKKALKHFFGLHQFRKRYRVGPHSLRQITVSPARSRSLPPGCVRSGSSTRFHCVHSSPCGRPRCCLRCASSGPGSGGSATRSSLA